MRNLSARPASTETFDLAEGPVWNERRDEVIWVDITAGMVHLGSLSGSQVERTRSIHVDETVGAAVPGLGDELLVAGRRALHHIDANGEPKATWPILPADRPSRLNDGSCDPAGRFLVGSLAQDDRTGGEALVRLDASGELAVLDNDLTLSNGLAWSPDGGTFYSVDTVPGILWRRNYDPATGESGVRSELLRITDGSPDGLAVDVEGNLWLAVWGAGQIRCYTPGGLLLAVVDVPAPHTSSVAFVGPDRDRLLITTARAELSPDQLREFPDSGRLFIAEPGIAGIPTSAWEPVHAPVDTGQGT